MDQIIMGIISDIMEIDISLNKSLNLIDTGVLDSLMMFHLMERLEEEFHIVMNGEDIIPENFQNIDTIVNLVNKELKNKN